MAKMPDIVRSRLQQKMAADSAHPDANLLAAFAERTLLERESAAVVAHLIECADCRECLALVLATAEPEEPMVVGRSVGAGFRGWIHEWRWIASAAACCLVAVGLQYYGEPPARVLPMSVPSRAAELQIVGAPQAQPSTPSAPLKLARKSKVVPPAAKQGGLVLMAAKKDVAVEDILTQPPPPAVRADPAEIALALRRSEAPKADAAASYVEPEQSAVGPAAASMQAPSAAEARKSIAPQGPEARASGFAAGMRLRAPLPRQKALLKAIESPRVLWSISASADTAEKARGVVQRSADAGQSWQIMPLSERVSFRAVATAGSDVWAGGSEGALFHSSDGGSHWAQVHVAAETGDIVGIVARPNMVTVTTSSGEEWTSVDGGKNWTRE